MSVDVTAVPLLEYDPGMLALIEPSRTQPEIDAPGVAVACFFPELIESLAIHGRALLDLPSREPLWDIDYHGRRMALFYPGVGASLAAYSLERVIAAGCHTIVACGGAGAMRPDLKMGHHVITVAEAVRDEGTSYHYLPPARHVAADPEVVAVLSAAVLRRGLPHLSGRTWTTDGLFRETPSRVARRQTEGCLTVEMEASALLAVAAFRGVQFGQYLYAGDDVSGEVWSERDWRQATDVRRLLVDLAAEAAFDLAARWANASQRCQVWG